MNDNRFTDQDIKKRYMGFYSDDRVFTYGLIPSFRAKLSSLSEFVREIKVGFARYYNKKHDRHGYFWGDRFKSVIVDKGETPVKSAALVFCEELNRVNPHKLSGLHRSKSILRIPELSALKNLFQKPIRASNITLFLKLKKNQNLSRDYPECIL